MIITCPECATRYSVDPAVIGAEGRKVRCIKCSHSWFQAPPEDLPRRVTPSPPPLVMPDAPEERYGRVPASARARRSAAGGGSAWLAWLLLIVAVAGTLGGGYLYRAEIVRMWPPAEQIYALAGLAPEPAGFGLDLRNVTSTEVALQNGRVLRVEGEIVNVSELVRDVPRLNGILLDASERELQRWSFRPSETRLLPGEAVPFASEIPNPAPDAARLTIIFDRNGR